MADMTRDTLRALRERAKAAMAEAEKEILICAGTGCIAGGSLKIYEYLKEECAKRGLTVRVGLLEEEGECACGGNHSVGLKKSG